MEKDSPPGAPARPSSPALRALQSLEQHLCKTANRTTLFRGGLTDRPDTGHHALAGRILWEAREYLNRAKLPGVPKKQDLATKAGVGPNHITHLLKGDPTGPNNWCRDVCPGLLAWMLQEFINNNPSSNPEVGRQMREVRDRIRFYFFRSQEPSTASPLPSFFAFERRFLGIPCSPQELAHEVAWFARQPDVGGFRSEISIVLGHRPLLPEGARQLVMSNLSDAISNGVKVYFIRPRLGDVVYGAETVAQFQREFPKSADGFHCLDATPEGLFWGGGAQGGAELVSEEGISFPWGHALHMRSVQLDEASHEEVKEISVHLAVRYFTATHHLPDHEPVAHAATHADILEFQRWRSSWRLDGTGHSSGQPAGMPQPTPPAQSS
jgi:hypothetical protein